MEYRRIETPLNWDSYSSLLIPEAQSFILNSPNPSHLVLLEAVEKEKRIGLALAEVIINQTDNTSNHPLINITDSILAPETRMAQLHSLMVEESHRCQGIGTSLLKTMQDILTEQENCVTIALGYNESLPSAPALERILEKMNWSTPHIYLYRYHFIAQEFQAKWYKARYKLPKDFKIFPWKKLMPFEKREIEHQEDQGRFFSYLSPFNNEKNIEYSNSFGLRYRNRVIGWSITHRIDPDTVRYMTLYIDKDFIMTGYAIILLIKSIHYQKLGPIPLSVFEINPKETERSWVNFVERRLKPYACKVERIKRAFQVFV